MRVDPDVRLDDGEHVAQFYGSDADLGRAVGDYLVPALIDGATAIVIATPDHRRHFLAEVAAGGVDVVRAQADGRLVLLDAADTLARISADGRVHPALFDDVIGSLVRAAAAHSPVRLFGEMVGLLWDAGDVGGAIELEDRWNELAAQVPFSLFCAYASEGVANLEAAKALSDICHCHTRLVATAPADPPRMQRYAPTVDGPRSARRFVAQTLREWRLDALVDDVALIVTEMATNAIMHVGGDFSVAMRRRDGGVRIVVGDSSRVAPTRRAQNDGRPGGYGLRLLDGMASAWGCELLTSGKLVWADFEHAN